MAIWKKVLIVLGIAILLFGAGFGTATLYFGSTSADLRERVKYITKQYDKASEAERRAIETVKELEGRLTSAEGSASSLEKQLGRLLEANNQLTNRVGELEGNIESIASGLSELEGATTASEGLLRESIRILLAISERSGKTNK